MSVAFYMDVHIPRVITSQLRVLGVDVLTAQEDGHAQADDHTLLNRATELARILFSHDQDFLAVAAQRQKSNEPFAGLVFGHTLETSIGRTISDLQLIAETTDPDDWLNRVEYLPL